MLRSSDRPFRHVATLVISLICSPLFAAQPGPPPPPKPTNLQFFPKDIAPAQLVTEMEAIAAALGVNCSHCHVEAPRLPTTLPGMAEHDFASDGKPAKATARRMLSMLAGINTMVPAAVAKAPASTTRVYCDTCHHGEPIPPEPLAYALNRATVERGIESAVAQYRYMRERDYGRHTYDLSRTPDDGTVLRGLDAYALQLIQADKAAEALTWLQVNLEKYPESGTSWALIGIANLRSNNKPAAIAALEKAVKAAPGMPLFGALLAQAKAMP